MMDDRELLRQYARHRTEDAFAELVQRHLNLVYSAALRQVGGDPHSAQDVVQSVFSDLARKAASLSGHGLITGWLYTSTRFAASKVRRSERRRKTREREAQAMNHVSEDPAPDSEWERLGPVLDEVMHELKQRDREALLLRYFEGQQLAEVGARLGLHENAARMRVERALERLRTLLARRGITSATAALAALLAANATVAAPGALAGIVNGAVLAGATVVSGAGFSALKFMSMIKLKGLTAGALVAAVIAVPLVVQHHSLEKLRLENGRLRADASQLAQLREENKQLAKSKTDPGELERLQQARNEVLRLRGEVGRLRREARAGTVKPVAAGQSGAASNEPTTNVPVITTYQANVRALISDGQTLVMVGRLGSDGKCLLTFATPSIEGQEGDQVLIRTRMVEVSEEMLARLNLDALEASDQGAERNTVVSLEKLSAISKMLNETNGVKVLSDSAVTTLGGRQAQLQNTEEKIVNGEKFNLGPVIDVLADISPDKKSVTLSLGMDLKREENSGP